MTYPSVPRSAAAPDYAAFLRRQLLLQPGNVASYPLNDEQVWLKKAGPRHGLWGYRALGLLARAARLPLLHPVPNLGGEQAIATEARRLRDLARRGLRVPAVLAQQPEGLLLAHLGRPGQPTPSLGDEIERAMAAGPEVVLALWLEGLQALSYVHATGTSLSQAFARNLVRCPDGTVGYIDFEDDPVAVLPLAHCQARDALCFVHSTALALVQAGALARWRLRRQRGSSGWCSAVRVCAAPWWTPPCAWAGCAICLPAGAWGAICSAPAPRTTYWRFCLGRKRAPEFLHTRCCPNSTVGGHRHAREKDVQ